jgi:transcriptional regulator with XRE-family HTH domain
VTSGDGQSRARRRTAKEHGPDPVDLHIGRRLRLGRELAGLTQTGIGRSLAMRFQVVQKYERGEIRVSASRLFALSQLLNKPIEYFFEGLEPDSDATATAAVTAALDAYVMERREVELLRAFRAIGDSEVRRRLATLVRDVAENPPE